jgi:hypothetical protein
MWCLANRHAMSGKNMTLFLAVLWFRTIFVAKFFPKNTGIYSGNFVPYGSKKVL